MAATITTILRLAHALNYKQLARVATKLSPQNPQNRVSAVGVDSEGCPLICANAVICRLEPEHYELYPSEHSMFDTLTTLAEMISSLDHPRAISVMDQNRGLVNRKSRGLITRVNAGGLNAIFDTDHPTLLATVQRRAEQDRQNKLQQEQANAERARRSEKNRALSSKVKVKPSSKKQASETPGRSSNPFWLDPEQQNWH